MRGHVGALRLPPAGSWPSHTARTDTRPCPTMPARAADHPALLPTTRQPPESTSKAKQYKSASAAVCALILHHTRMETTAAAAVHAQVDLEITSNWRPLADFGEGDLPPGPDTTSTSPQEDSTSDGNAAPVRPASLPLGLPAAP